MRKQNLGKFWSDWYIRNRGDLDPILQADPFKDWTRNIRAHGYAEEDLQLAIMLCMSQDKAASEYAVQFAERAIAVCNKAIDLGQSKVGRNKPEFPLNESLLYRCRAYSQKIVCGEVVMDDLTKSIDLMSGWYQSAVRDRFGQEIQKYVLSALSSCILTSTQDKDGWIASCIPRLTQWKRHRNCLTQLHKAAYVTDGSEGKSGVSLADFDVLFDELRGVKSTEIILAFEYACLRHSLFEADGGGGLQQVVSQLLY